MAKPPTKIERNTTKGIRDWQKKKLVIRLVLNAFTVGDIVEKIYPDDIDKAEKAASKFRTWHETSPKSKDSREFFDILAVKMQCTPKTTGVQLVESSIERFISFLSSTDSQNAAYEALDATNLDENTDTIHKSISIDEYERLFLINSRKTLSSFYNIFMPRQGKLETISSGVHRGRVDEKHYYLTPEAALTWNEVINADLYPTYDQCRSGLKALIASSVWKALIQERPISAAVMLCGGGSPTKDLVIIKEIIEQSSKDNSAIDYVILDVSPYMLISSMWWLGETLAAVPGGERINLIALCKDVLTEFDRTAYERGADRNLFAITGGTIGNIREAKLFRHIPAYRGDLLIVSADSHPENDLSTAESLIEKYNHSAIRKFVSPAINALIREFDLQENFSSVCDRVEVKITEGGTANSDVPNSASIVLNIDVNGRNIVLLNSTRYMHDELIIFARQYGWQHKHSIGSPTNPNFIQFLFEKFS